MKNTCEKLGEDNVDDNFHPIQLLTIFLNDLFDGSFEKRANAVLMCNRFDNGCNCSVL